MPLQTVKRADFSNGLVHLTRERIEYKAAASFFDAVEFERLVPPFEVLKEILTSGVIRASGNEGYVKGTQKAVCFREVPLSSVQQFASAPQEQKARYRFYGVSLSKRQSSRLVADRSSIYRTPKQSGYLQIIDGATSGTNTEP